VASVGHQLDLPEGPVTSSEEDKGEGLIRRSSGSGRKFEVLILQAREGGPKFEVVILRG
jgi:hypothetical protein